MKHVNRVMHADRHGAGEARDARFTRRARGFLQRVAGELRLRAGEHEITVASRCQNRGCRVTLGTARLIVEVSDLPVNQSVRMSFRTRRGYADLSGGGDNAVSAEQLGTREGFESLLGALRLVNGLDSERR